MIACFSQLTEKLFQPHGLNAFNVFKRPKDDHLKRNIQLTLTKTRNLCHFSGQVYQAPPNRQVHKAVSYCKYIHSIESL